MVFELRDNDLRLVERYFGYGTEFLKQLPFGGRIQPVVGTMCHDLQAQRNSSVFVTIDREVGERALNRRFGPSAFLICFNLNKF